MMSKTNKTKIHALYNEEILFPDFAPITPKDIFT